MTIRSVMVYVKQQVIDIQEERKKWSEESSTCWNFINGPKEEVV